MKTSFSARPFLIAAYCGSLLSGASFFSAHAQTYSGPLVITDANCGTASSPSCTFTGNWQAADPGTATITISTSRAVTIQNSRIISQGTAIKVNSGYNSSLTVRNTRCYGLNLNTTNIQGGRFLHATDVRSITVENCYLEGTAGIYLYRYTGDHSSGNTVRIRYNKVRNIDGRISDGNGGYKTGNKRDTDYRKVHFVQFGEMDGLSNAEISWNEIIEYVGQSRVEDTISIYEGSSGASASDPIRIHDNYIQGAYPVDPATMNFTGLGIIIDGPANYVEAYNNQIVGAGPIGIQGGQYNIFRDNRIVARGYLPDGTSIKFMENSTAVAISDYRDTGLMSNNSAWNNVGRYRPRLDLNGPVYFQGGTYVTPPVSVRPFPDANIYQCNPVRTPATLADEQAEWPLWLSKSGSQGIGVSTSESNRINNASFEADGADTNTPSNWLESGDVTTSKVETYDRDGGTGGHTGARHATHYSSSPYEVSTYSYPTGLTKGLYTAKAWVRRGSGQTLCQLRVREFNGSNLSEIRSIDLPVTNTWTQVSVPDIPVTNTHCIVELYSKAGGGQWMYFDDVELRKQ